MCICVYFSGGDAVCVVAEYNQATLFISCQLLAMQQIRIGTYVTIKRSIHIHATMVCIFKSCYVYCMYYTIHCVYTSSSSMTTLYYICVVRITKNVAHDFSPLAIMRILHEKK